MKFKRFFICFLVCCFARSVAIAQLDDVQLHPLDFQVFKTTQDTLTIATLTNNPTIPFVDPEIYPKIKPIDIYWIRIDFSPYLDRITSDRVWYLYTEVFHKAVIYSQSNNQIQETVCGSFQTQNTPHNSFPFYKDQLIQDRYLYLKVSRLANRVPISQSKFYYASDVFNHFKQLKQSETVSKKRALTYVYFGISFIIVLIALTVGLITKRREYLYYILYIIGMVFYIGRSYFSDIMSYLKITSQITFFLNLYVEIFCNIFYILFVKHYLDTKSQYPKLDKAIRGINFFLIAITITDSIYLLNENYTVHFYFFDIRVVGISAFALLSIIYLLVYAKNKLVYFIVIGSLAYSIGSILLFVKTDVSFLLYGILLEIIIFGFGLGYKVYLEQQAKRRAEQQAHINHIQALRAQMNPHFIFNSLSSIQHLVLKNDTQSALSYLSKFSKLMRSTLESSIEKNVLLDEEIKLLQAYLELEKLRFENDFSYAITAAPQIDTSKYEVPLLIVQPFAENAILHGLLHKKEGLKELLIHFDDNEHFLICTIKDNGIGRAESRKINEQKSRYKAVSRGVELTEKRLRALYQKNNRYIPIEIHDLYDENDAPVGTEVILNIPKN